ncbi:PREDICTED: uncharacterized protein LOC109183033 [Ipomoea nil]|uniref:uncharacterized protein LOC109183033 n=1 Tax=Ipomoea nil TaxID=35883 RepID=UPI000900E4F3|nr:PREDICTED: uncharacterized protein LOC109183033 [Ipomoea nil]
MEHTKALPQLVVDNYAYWKVRMRTHLKAQGEAAWCIVVTGWDHPTKASTSEDETRVTKPENEWTQAEKRVMIQLKSDFEELRMNEDETIVTFHTRVQELANRAMVLGEPFNQEKLVKKILRSLPPRFRMKVTAIQEHDNWEKKTVTQLMGNLRTYEMEILTDHTKKQETVAFTAEENNCIPDLDEIGDDPVSKGSRNKNMQKGASSSKANPKSGSSTFKPSGSRPGQSKEKPNITWSDDDSDGETGGSDPDEISGNFVAFTAHMAAGPCHEDVADSEGGEYISAEDLESSESSFEIEFNKLYPKWAALSKENCRLTSEIGIVTNAKKVYQTQIADRDLLLKEELAQEEKLKQEETAERIKRCLSKRQALVEEIFQNLAQRHIALVQINIDETELWHQKLGHLSYRLLDKLVKIEGVRGLPKLKVKPTICGACQAGKQTKSSHPAQHTINTSHCLELIYMDLIGPTQTESVGGKKYRLVCVDDYSRFSWVTFLRDKSETLEAFKTLGLKLQKERNEPIIRIRSDHGREFDNNLFDTFCNQTGITHEYSAPKTPQQNGVVERKNRTIQEMGRVLLNAK